MLPSGRDTRHHSGVVQLDEIRIDDVRLSDGLAGLDPIGQQSRLDGIRNTIDEARAAAAARNTRA